MQVSILTYADMYNIVQEMGATVGAIKSFSDRTIARLTEDTSSRPADSFAAGGPALRYTSPVCCSTCHAPECLPECLSSCLCDSPTRRHGADVTWLQSAAQQCTSAAWPKTRDQAQLCASPAALCFGSGRRGPSGKQLCTALHLIRLCGCVQAQQSEWPKEQQRPHLWQWANRPSRSTSSWSACCTQMQPPGCMQANEAARAMYASTTQCNVQWP